MRGPSNGINGPSISWNSSKYMAWDNAVASPPLELNNTGEALKLEKQIKANFYGAVTHIDRIQLLRFVSIQTTHPIAVKGNRQ